MLEDEGLTPCELSSTWSRLCMYIYSYQIVNTRLDALANVNRRRCTAVFPVASFCCP